MKYYLAFLFCCFMASGADSHPSTPSPSNTTNTYSYPSLAKQTVLLTVHGALDHALIAPLFRAFITQHPHTQIQYTQLNTNALYQTFLDAPQERPDIMMSPAMDLQFKLVNDGFALRNDSPPPQSLPMDSQWRQELFGFTYEPIVMVINTDILTGSPLPTSREQLLTLIRDKDHLLDGKIGLFDIKKIGLGYLAWSYDSQQSRTYGRLLEAFGNHKAQLYTDTHTMLEALLKGDLFIAYNLVGSYAFQWSKKYPWIVTLMPTDYTSIIMRTAFINRQTTHPKTAKFFIDFLLSHQGQSLLEASGITPLDRHITGQNSRQALQKLPHGIFRPIPLGLELLIQTDSAKKQLIYDEWDEALGSSMSPSQ
ncbi:hypothetical protein MSP8887_01288 [Marinomonas spartinae]|uniref:Bacterial extracellular solute-binding protein n=1 Tax=Marinomonas spartinae TaxID=1792290 RepID=A0A1A8TT75_9GAMM|nr:ABC transporter substrate-binding protein [Marinomonas spartinae]SBS30396.1 hypothetical protein MSP8887_01288 [Marinomonas spartinae]SBS36247.1 hypothetical protein MSP8886_03623 [Marinomonas spartinae]